MREAGQAVGDHNRPRLDLLAAVEADEKSAAAPVDPAHHGGLDPGAQLLSEHLSVADELPDWRDLVVAELRNISGRLEVRQGESRPRRSEAGRPWRDRKSTRLNSSHLVISYA